MVMSSSPPVLDEGTGKPNPEGALPTLQAGGFSAAVDACAWEVDPDSAAHRMRMWFLSLLGAQEAVKALWARLIKGETATMALEQLGTARFCALAPEGPRQWRFFTASLRSVAGYHGVLVPEASRYGAERTDFIVLPRSVQEGPLLHYRYLNRRLDLPLHGDWAPWLWERGLRVGEIVALESWGAQAYRCVPNPDALAADLSEAIRRRAVAIPEDPTAVRAAA
jgi:hypothetical protein